MVLKQERKVNSSSVAKRQALRANANARKERLQEEEKERVLAAAWSVGTNERALQREAAEAKKAAHRDEKEAVKDSANRAEEEAFAGAPSIVNKKLQKKSQSADDLFGMALIEEEFNRSRKKKPTTPAKPPSPRSEHAAPRARGDIVFDTSDEPPRNCNHDVDLEEARTLDDAIDLLNDITKSKRHHSAGNLSSLSSPSKSLNGMSRRGVRKVPSKSSLFYLEHTTEAIRISG